MKRPTGLKKISGKPIPKPKSKGKQDTDDAWLDDMLE
jgi:hypothetical protein